MLIVHSKSTAELGFSALVTVECMHAGVSGAVSHASVVLQRPGYGFSQAFCWCSFAGTLTSQASPAPIRDSSRDSRGGTERPAVWLMKTKAAENATLLLSLIHI